MWKNVLYQLLIERKILYRSRHNISLFGWFALEKFFFKTAYSVFGSKKRITYDLHSWGGTHISNLSLVIKIEEQFVSDNFDKDQVETLETNICFLTNFTFEILLHLRSARTILN